MQADRDVARDAFAVDDAGMELSKTQRARLRAYVELADSRAGAAKNAGEVVQRLQAERRELREQLQAHDRHIKGLRLPADAPESHERTKLSRELAVVEEELNAATARHQSASDQWGAVGNLCRRLFEHLDLGTGTDAPGMLRKLRHG